MSQSQSPNPTEFLDSEDFSPVAIANENLRRFQEEKEQLIAEIRQMRVQNENLQKICANQKQNLAVAQDHFESEGIDELEEEKVNLLAEIEITKSNTFNAEEDLAYAGYELQMECIELTESIASMHLEYKSSESVQNGGMTKLVKIQEMKKQIGEADKAIANFRQLIAEAETRSGINLDEAMHLIIGADEFLIALESQAAVLKQQIASLKQRNENS